MTVDRKKRPAPASPVNSPVQAADSKNQMLGLALESEIIPTLLQLLSRKNNAAPATTHRSTKKNRTHSNRATCKALQKQSIKNKNCETSRQMTWIESVANDRMQAKLKQTTPINDSIQLLQSTDKLATDSHTG